MSLVRPQALKTVFKGSHWKISPIVAYRFDTRLEEVHEFFCRETGITVRNIEGEEHSLEDVLKGNQNEYVKLGGFKEGKLVGYCEYFTRFNGIRFRNCINITSLLVQEETEKTNMLAAFSQYLLAQNPLPLNYVAI